MPDPATLPNAYTYAAPDTALSTLHGSGLHVDDRQEIRRLKSGLLVASNPIINGGFQSWQRGGTFTSAGDSTRHADCWIYYKAGSMVHDILRSTDVPPIANLLPFQTYSLLIDCTTVDSSIGASEYAILSGAIEGYNWAPYAQYPCTLTFWHKHTKTGIYVVGMRNVAPDRSCVMEYTQAVADTWELATVVFPASPAAGTWNYTTGIGVFMTWMLATGSTFSTTPGTWQVGNFITTPNQVNACDNTANNFRIWGVQLARGSEGLPFSPRSFGLEELLCKRYVQVWSSDHIGAAKSGSTLYSEVLRFPVDFRAIPSVPAGAAFQVSAGAAGTPAFSNISKRSCRPTNSGTAWTVDALVSLSATFTAEIG